MTTKLLKLAETPLERHVARWIDDNEDPKDTAKDLLQYGCQSGMVGHLIYYRDTLAFYRKFRKEIDAMYYEALRDFGEDFRLNGWDNEDPFAREDQNRNTLAWFGFEETARKLADRAGWEI